MCDLFDVLDRSIEVWVLNDDARNAIIERFRQRRDIQLKWIVARRQGCRQHDTGAAGAAAVAGRAWSGYCFGRGSATWRATGFRWALCGVARLEHAPCSTDAWQAGGHHD